MVMSLCCPKSFSIFALIASSIAQTPHLSIASPAMPAHVFKPACAFLVVGKGESIKVLTDWPHPGEAQHTALETAHSVCAEIPTVEQRWHPHRDDNPRRAANEQSPRKMGG